VIETSSRDSFTEGEYLTLEAQSREEDREGVECFFPLRAFLCAFA
jgi:hypothetical protein